MQRYSYPSNSSQSCSNRELSLAACPLQQPGYDCGERSVRVSVAEFNTLAGYFNIPAHPDCPDFAELSDNTAFVDYPGGNP